MANMADEEHSLFLIFNLEKCVDGARPPSKREEAPGALWEAAWEGGDLVAPKSLCPARHVAPELLGSSVTPAASRCTSGVQGLPRPAWPPEGVGRERGGVPSPVLPGPGCVVFPGEQGLMLQVENRSGRSHSSRARLGLVRKSDSVPSAWTPRAWACQCCRSPRPLWSWPPLCCRAAWHTRCLNDCPLSPLGTHQTHRHFLVTGLRTLTPSSMA